MTEGYEPAMCLGICQRLVRAANLRLEDMPGSVIGYRDGMCSSCWELSQSYRPMTKREHLAMESFEAWRRARDKRILDKTRKELWHKHQHQIEARRKYEEAQIAKYGSLPIRESRRVDLLEQFADRPSFDTQMVHPGYHRLRENRLTGPNERVEKIEGGTIRYIRDSRGDWRFSILINNGAVVLQSEAYAALRNARRGAQRLLDKQPQEAGPSDG